MMEYQYARWGPCPECGERAIKKSGVGSVNYACNACGAVFDEIEEYGDHPADVDVWDPEQAVEEARLPDDDREDWEVMRDMKEDQWQARQARNAAEAPSEDTTPTPEDGLTDLQKSKQHLSSAFWVIGILFCVTLIGIPFGLICFFMAGVVAPDPEEYGPDGEPVEIEQA